ncbi:hypothetical protein, partial [Sulfitobacter sp.]|uniref:hypothetical protein n=1 Tax=Sulfitobacter sp. TaxID=1903071 RepID=UPI003001CEAA
MPYAPSILGLKFEIRIADLTARDVVIVTCPACHWSANVAPHVLKWSGKIGQRAKMYPTRT